MKKSAVVIMLFSFLIVLFAFFAVMRSASAQSLSSSLGVMTYPSKGQSAQQQSKDEGECFAWAKQQTGIDPFAVTGAPTQQAGPAAGGGERVRGAARGAAGGAAIAGDAGKGAAIGAVSGTLLGGHRARQNKAAQQQQAEQAKAGAIQQFNKAFGVCMEGRGYAVK
jgi:hypothetical protein